MKHLLTALLMLIAPAALATEPPAIMPYNTPVRIGTDSWILFEDFDLHTKHDPALANDDRTLNHYRFEIREKGDVRPLEFTFVRGKPVPQPFTANGKEFYLERSLTLLPRNELKGREKIPALADDELVVLTAEKYAQVTRHKKNKAN